MDSLRFRTVLQSSPQPHDIRAEVNGMEEVRPFRRYFWSPIRPTAVGFALLLGVLMLAGAGKAVLYDTLDPDLFWHLRVADQLDVQRYPAPLVDDLSFASIKTAWTPYSWLADLAFKRLWDAGGFRAAIVAQAAMTAGLVLFISLSALEITIERFGRPRYLAAALAGFAGEFLALPYLSFRPVTIVLVLLTAAAWLLQRDRRLNQQSWLVWLVAPIAALMINIHLYAVFLPAAVMGLLAGAIWDHRGARRYFAMFALTSAACLMTPMLPGVIEAAWHYQFADVMVAGHVIAEMQPFYYGQFGFIAAGLVLAIVIAAIFNRRALSSAQWLWLAGGLLVMLRLGRFAPVFAIFAAPTLAVTLPRLSDLPLARRTTHLALAMLLLVACFRISSSFPNDQTTLSTWINRMGPDCGGYPTLAADFVADHIPPRSHHLISEFTWGGYLEWRLGDCWQVLMDGRTQLYTADFWKTVYLGTPQARKDYLAVLTADAAILPVKGSAFRQDLLDLGWRAVWRDERAEVLVPGKKESMKGVKV